MLWRSYGSRSATERRKVVAHELVHAALANRTSARTPPWLYEGIAMYASGDNRSGDAGALISGRGVLRDASKQGAAKAAMSLTRLSNAARARQHVVGLARVRLLVLVGGRVRDRATSTAARRCCACITAYNSEKIKGARAQARRPGRAARRCKKSLKTLESEVDAVRRVELEVLASLLGRCPSFPKSRRSAAIWRPTSKGGRWRPWRSSTSAGAGRSRPPS